jgi:hypothetical protein
MRCYNLGHSMSASLKPSRRNPLLTPRLDDARKEFLKALTEAITTSDIYRDQAEGLLSGMLCDLWNEGDVLARRLAKRHPDNLVNWRRKAEPEPVSQESMDDDEIWF